MQQKQPSAFIFAGANASGKSTFIAHLLLNKVIFGEYINPDLILKDELRLEETTENYLKAFKIAEKRRYEAIINSKDIIVETVFSTQEKIDYIYKLIENGYHITLFFTGTDDPAINMLYLLDRVQNGGHDVPVRKLLDRRLRGFQNIKAVYKDIDCLIFMDNSIYNEPPLIIKSLYKNNICFIPNNHNREATWLEDILEDNIKILQGDELKIVPQAHLQLCENIQNSSHTFRTTLEKTYVEKNKVLSKESKSN